MYQPSSIECDSGDSRNLRQKWCGLAVTESVVYLYNNSQSLPFLALSLRLWAPVASIYSLSRDEYLLL